MRLSRIFGYGLPVQSSHCLSALLILENDMSSNCFVGSLDSNYLS